MSENIPENSPVGLKRFYFVLWTMLSVVLISSLCALFILTRPAPLLPATPAGEIIDHLGIYVSPNRLNTADIYINKQGELSVIFHSNITAQSSSWTSSKTDVWFATIDDLDRFWWYGEGEGHVFSVEFTGSASTTTIVGISGGWEGIPQSFLDKLPESEIKKYETWKRNKLGLPPTNIPETTESTEKVPASSPAN